MQLPTSKQFKSTYPLPFKAQEKILQHRKTVHDILLGKDPRLALVVGPCSLHNVDSAVFYAKKLQKLAKSVEKTCFIVMRAYLEKPRTITGWKGFLYDPHLDGSNDILQGLHLSRKLLLKLTEIGIPLATEILDPFAYGYIDDLISWGFIGARTSTSSTHRQIASSLNFPVGFKNTTDGNIENAIHGILAARDSHPYISIDEEGRLVAKQSEGNSATHIVLRGSNTKPNFDALSIASAIDKQSKERVHSRILIDCSHGNSGKQHEKQVEVFQEVLEQVIQGNTKIMGMMLESHLEAGNQMLSEDTSSLRSSVSVTDPCIDWSSTQELIELADEWLSSSSPSSLVALEGS